MKKQLQRIITLLGLSLILINPSSLNGQEYWWENWEKNPANPVIQEGPDTWFEHAIGSPVINDNGNFKMWFSGWGVIDNIRRVGYAEYNGILWDIHPTYVFSGTALGPNIYIDCVLKINDTLKMWYTGFESFNPYTPNIGYAWSMDGINWNEHPEAVLTPGPAGSWDYPIISNANVIYDGNMYHMYYCNFSGIGYASSPNGINWTKDTVHNPIHWIHPGTFYSGGMMSSGAILYNDTIHMWFTGRVSSPTIRDRVGYGYSTDYFSFTWFEDTAVDIGPMVWDAAGVDYPCVLVVDGQYKMWYTGTPPVNHFKIGEADGPMASCVPVYFSGCENGDGFDDFILNEIQNNGSGCESLNGTGWSEYHNLGPAIVYPGETYTLTISSNNDMQYATVWVDWNRNGEYEDEEIMIDNFIMEEAGVQYELDFNTPSNITPNATYNMRAKTNCNATCDDPCKNYYFGETEDYIIDYPVGIKEIQSIDFEIAPNPFTTSTTFSYSIYKPSTVTISIFNPQGQLIEKIEQEQPKGEQQVLWIAEGLPAGMYYFRIQSGEMIGGGKMILIK